MICYYSDSSRSWAALITLGFPLTRELHMKEAWREAPGTAQFCHSRESGDPGAEFRGAVHSIPITRY